MEYFVQHEGQKIPVPADIAADETKLRRALSTIVPGIAEAQITSAEKDGVTTFTVIKTAGTKGAVSSPLDHLIGCKGGLNPVIAYYQALAGIDLTGVSPADTVVMDQEIEKALEKGQSQVDKMLKATKRLCASTPQPSPFRILGF